MKNERNDKAIAEIVGTIILIAMVVAVFTVIYTQVLSDDGPSPHADVTISGKMQITDFTTDRIGAQIEHRSGETISADSEVILTLHGSQLPPLPVSYLLIDSNRDGEWNIGEHLIYDELDLTGWNVGVKVVDTDTNELVLTGILQPGYISSDFGLGGIWHFNEIWDSDPYTFEVIDSSTNGNDGTADGAETIGEDSSDYDPIDSDVPTRYGSFNGFEDKVDIPNDPSLNLQDTITIEAWIKPEPFDPKIDELELNQKFGYTPYIIRNEGSSENALFTIVSEFQSKGGAISTVTIDNLGIIEQTPHEAIFGSATADQKMRPVMIHVGNDVYLVAFNNNDLHITLKTYTISPEGEPTYLNQEEIFTDSDTSPSNDNINRPTIINVHDDLFAIAYRGDGCGILKTITVSPLTGEISVEDTDYFSSSDCYELNLSRINDDLIALVYRDDSDVGVIKTFNVDSNRDIDYTEESTNFDDLRGYAPHIVKIHDDIDDTIAIVYSGSSNDGTIKTFKIYADGSIDDLNQVKIFDVDCYNPWMVHHSDNIYVIVYSDKATGSPDGWYLTVEINPDGSIGDIIDPKTNFESGQCHDPIIIKVAPRLFAITYTGQGDHPGNLVTIVIGDDPTPITSRGIVKGGSASLYANTERVYASINGLESNMISLPVDADQWNHIIFTYDKQYMRLYCFNVNDVLDTLTIGQLESAPYWEENYVSRNDYHEQINSNPGNHIFFGQHYCGMIDEIAILENVLTLPDIKYLHASPNIGNYESLI